MTGEILIEFPGGIDELATLVREALGIANRNSLKGVEEQRRDSVQQGGTYYLLQWGRREIYLLPNRGEAELADSTAPYYALVRPGPNEHFDEAQLALADDLARLVPNNVAVRLNGG